MHVLGHVSGTPKRFVYILRSDHDPAIRDGPWQVIVSIEFRTQEAALVFERDLKTGSGRAFAKRHFP